MIRRLTALALWLLSLSAGAEPVEFTLPDLHGKTVRLSDYRGKWVVVNFWASWCGPCVKELPDLAAFQAQAPHNIQIIAINYEDTTVGHTRAFLDGLAPLNFPQLKFDGSDTGLPTTFFVDHDGRLRALEGLPSSYFIDPDGELRDVHLGALTGETLSRKLLELQ